MGVSRRLAWLIVALGAFGFVIPFVGPLFNFGMGHAPAFAVTSARVIRHVIPGAAVIIGGLLLLSQSLETRRWGGWLAVVGGAWLGVVPFLLQAESFTLLARRAVYHSGNGLLIVVLAAYVLGRMSAAEAREEARPALAVSEEKKPAQA